MRRVFLLGQVYVPGWEWLFTLEMFCETVLSPFSSFPPPPLFCFVRFSSFQFRCLPVGLFSWSFYSYPLVFVLSLSLRLF